MLVNRLARRDPAAASTTSCCSAAPSACYTRWRARRIEPKAWLDWTQADDPPCPSVLGRRPPGIEPRTRWRTWRSRRRRSTRCSRPRCAPPRVAASTSTSVHRRACGRGFAAVAAEQPARVVAHAVHRRGDPHRRRPTTAWSRSRTPKRMCANIDVDQAAALRALLVRGGSRAPGVPDDRLVFPLAGADAHDHYFFTERASLGRSRRRSGSPRRAALAAAGIAVDDVARFDLYSCFPSAVRAGPAVARARRTRRRRRPPAHRHRRPRLRGWAGQQLLHPLHRGDGRRVPPRPGLGRARDRARLVRDQALASGLYSTVPPAAGFVAVDPADTQRAVDARPAARARGRRRRRGASWRRRRSIVRARRHPEHRDRHRADRRRAPRARELPGTAPRWPRCASSRGRARTVELAERRRHQQLAVVNAHGLSARSASSRSST